MSKRHESMVCPFMHQNKKMCPMAYGNMPYMQNVYDYEEHTDENNMYTKIYDDDYMSDEEHYPMSYDKYPMMMPMPMVIEFEDEEE